MHHILDNAVGVVDNCCQEDCIAHADNLAELLQAQEEVVDILEMEEDHSSQMWVVVHKEDTLDLDHMRILDLGEVVRNRAGVGRNILEGAAKN